MQGCMMTAKREQQVNFTKIRRISQLGVVSDVCLFLGEVDLVTKTQGHPLWEEGKKKLL